MSLGETKIDYVHLFVILAEHEIRSFDVSVDKPTLMNFLDSLQHFNQQLYGNLQTVIDFKYLSYFCQIRTEKVHNNQVLLTVFNKIVYATNMLKTIQVLQDVKLKVQDIFILVLFLNFERNILLQNLIISLINETYRNNKKLIRNFWLMWWFVYLLKVPWPNFCLIVNLSEILRFSLIWCVGADECTGITAPGPVFGGYFCETTTGI